MPQTGRSESAVHMSFAERTSFPSLQYLPIAHIFSVLWLVKVILRDSKTNSFRNISYGGQEEVVMVTA